MGAKDKNRLKVLYLARWYPNRWDPMLGLFIKRHAEAANSCSDVGVVYAQQIEERICEYQTYLTDFNEENNVPTAKVYYLSSKVKLFYINKLINIFRFFRANIIGIRRIKKHLGEFNIVHVHVLSRLGIIALYYRIFHRKPYGISEHWSRYLDLTGSFNGFARKLVTRVIVKYASFITTVTYNLANAMQSHNLKNDNYIVLPNVVDSVFLNKPNTSLQKNDPVKFIHVSCFEDKSKNISGLLRTISELSKIRNDFDFRLVGDGMDMDSLRDYASKLGLTDKQVIFTGLLEGAKLAGEMAAADMMIVFSNYENFPVVINESLSLGIPVLATRVGGIPERINNDNGVLIDAGDEDQLLANLISFLDDKSSFNMDNIKMEAREEFSPTTIGKTLCDLYSQTIK